MKTLFLIPLIFFLFEKIDAQDIVFYADVMVNADEPKHRTLAAEEFEQLFQKELKKPSSFKNEFQELKWVSIVYPVDKSFRIISWQIQYDDNQYRYKTIFQKSDGEIYRAAGIRGQNTRKIKQPLDFEKWSGGLVYNIVSPRKNEYYLQSYAQIDPYTKLKTLEPIIIEKENITLGKSQLFKSDESINSRIVIEYSADTNASIRYISEIERFVFDHMTVIQGRMQGQGVTQVPDGTYQAFDRDGTSWNHVDMLVHSGNDGPLNPQMQKRLNNELFRDKN